MTENLRHALTKNIKKQFPRFASLAERLSLRSPWKKAGTDSQLAIGRIFSSGIMVGGFLLFASPIVWSDNTPVPPPKELDELMATLKNPFIPKIPQTEKPPAPKEQQPSPTPKPADLAEKIQPTRPDFHVSGLVWNTDRPQAIVNNQVVAVGDTLDGWTISQITKKGVAVTYEDTTTFLIEPALPSKSPKENLYEKLPRVDLGRQPVPSSRPRIPGAKY